MIGTWVSPLVTVACFTACGLAVSRSFRSDPHRHDVGAVMLCGWAVFAVLCALTHALGLNLNQMLWGWMALAAAGLVRLASIPNRGPEWNAPGWSVATAFAIGGGIPLVLHLVQPPSVSLHGDDLAHTAHILEVLRTGVPFPGSDFYPVSQSTGADPRFGIVHVMYALLLGPWSDSIVDAWLWLSVPTGAGLAVSFIIFASRFVAGRWMLLLTLLMHLAFFGGNRFPLSTFAMYPMWVGQGLLFLVLARVLDRSGQPVPVTRDLGLLSGALMLIMVHYFPAIAFLTAAGLLWLAPGPDRRHRLMWLLSLLLAVLPGVLFRLVISYENVNPIHREPWLSVTLGGPWKMFQPIPVALTLSALWVVAALMAWIALRRRDDPGRTWLALMTLVPPAIALLPPTATLGMSVIGFLTFRLLLLAPSAVLVGSVWSTTRWQWASSTATKAIATVALATLAMTKLSGQWGHPEFAYAGEFREAVEASRVTIPANATVLADPYVSLALTGDPGHRVVVLPDGRSSPRDDRAIERLLAVGQFFSVEASAQERWAAAAQLGASHVWIQDTYDGERLGYYFGVRPGARPAVVASLREHPASFPEVASGENWWLFRRTEAAPAATESAPLPSVEGDRAIGPLSLAAFRVPPVASPGEKIQLELEWILRQPLPDPPYLVAYLRLDHATEVGGSKPLRKVRERLSGQIHRRTLRFEPGGIESPAYLLRVGETTRDRLGLTVPSSLVPGEYVIRLHVEPGRRSREIRLTDYFRDLDSYSGVEVARIQIEPRTSR